jgi:hypothetical protein
MDTAFFGNHDAGSKKKNAKKVPEEWIYVGRHTLPLKLVVFVAIYLLHRCKALRSTVYTATLFIVPERRTGHATLSPRAPRPRRPY